MESKPKKDEKKEKKDKKKLIDQTGFIGNLTETEQAVLDEFKKYL